MRRFLLLLTAMTFVAVISFAQTVILDFEEANTTTDFQFFGGSLHVTLSQNIATPNPTGVNTSATVCEFKKSADAPEWGGGFTNPDPLVQVDLTGNEVEICVDFHTDHAGNLTLKLENSPTVGDWIQTQDNTVVNEWVTICYDMTQASFEAPFEFATGTVFTRVVLFTDFGTPGTGTEAISYIDNIVISDPVSIADLNVVDNLFNMTPTLVSDHALLTFEDSNAGDRQFSVVSITGQMLIDQNIDGIVPSHEIQTEGWAPGLYIAKVQRGKDLQVIKFVVH